MPKHKRFSDNVPCDCEECMPDIEEPFNPIVLEKEEEKCLSGMGDCGPPITSVYGSCFCEKCVRSFAAEDKAHKTRPHLF